MVKKRLIASNNSTPTLYDIHQAIKDIKKAKSPEEEDLLEEEIKEMLKKLQDIENYSKQSYTSKNTSIARGGEPASLFKNVHEAGGFIGSNFDNGGGKHDYAIEWFLKTYGADGFENFLFDPYNRTPEYNIENYKHRNYDTSTIANVLNVIDDEDEIKNVLKNSKDRAGIVYIDVYERDGSGEGTVTKKDQYQRNAKIVEYLPFIKEVFGEDNVSFNSKFITAWTPAKLIRKYGEEVAQQMIAELKSKRFHNPTTKQKARVQEQIQDEAKKVTLSVYKRKKRLIKANESDLDLNNPNFQLKTQKGTVIKRSNYGVGKKMLNQYYVHKNYAEDIVPTQILQKAQDILEDEYPDFEYQCIMYEPNTGLVRFDEAPDFNTAREPQVGNFIKVDKDGNAKKGSSSNIWHHKWLWVKDDYDGFDVNESKLWSAKWLDVLPTTAKGTMKTWTKQLQEHGLPLDEKKALN